MGAEEIEEVAENGDIDEVEIAAIEEQLVADADVEGSPEPDEEILEDEAADDEDGVGVDEEDLVEENATDGSLRLKRLLSEDAAGDGPDSKRRKVDENVAKSAKALLSRWGLMECAVSKHVLEGITIEELELITKSMWQPNRTDHKKTASELISRYAADLRERKMVKGGSMDTVAAFKATWKLGPKEDIIMKKFTHKQLSHLYENFDGTKSVEDVVKEAALLDKRLDSSCANDTGLATMARSSRLELIDPVADCAVFGDANLTFSIRLAKHRLAMGHVGRVIATTFEKIGTLRERYPEIDASIKSLQDDFAEVYHDVDCTRIDQTKDFEGLERSLGAVYYNFPHSGAIQGFFDGHPMVNWRHENLMRLFFRALRGFVKPGAVVKVASNQNATGVRYSYIVGSALDNEFTHTETVPFVEWHLHRYGRSYGDRRDSHKRLDSNNNQSYNAQNQSLDMVYCFRYAPSGKPLPPQEIRMPPTLSVLKQVQDGPFKIKDCAELKPKDVRMKLAKQLHERFVLEVSGTHVG